MRTVSIRQIDMKRAVIPLGFEGENEFTTVRIDCKKTFDEHPTAIPSLAVTDPAGNQYPAVIVRDGNYVEWTVTASDLTTRGDGEIQIIFTVDDDIIGKTDPAKTKINRSITPSGQAPSGIQNFIQQAGETLGEVQQALVDIPTTIDTALAEAKASGEFDGADGAPGADGYSPSAIVTKSGKVATISITDKNGTTTETVSDGADGHDGADGKDGKDGQDGQDGAPGQDGQDGAPGQDGYSPSVAVTDITGGHRVTITDAEGDHTFDVMDGANPVEPQWELIKEVTTTQNQTEISIDTDSYGENFLLDELICTFEAPASTTGNRDAFYGQFTFMNPDTGNANTTSIPSLTYPTATSTMCAKAEIKSHKNAPVEVKVVTSTSEGNSQNLLAMPKTIKTDGITAIRIYQSGETKTLVPSGTIMKLYGRRRWTT